MKKVKPLVPVLILLLCGLYAGSCTVDRSFRITLENPEKYFLTKLTVVDPKLDRKLEFLSPTNKPIVFYLAGEASPKFYIEYMESGTTDVKVAETELYINSGQKVKMTPKGNNIKAEFLDLF